MASDNKRMTSQARALWPRLAAGIFVLLLLTVTAFGMWLLDTESGARTVLSALSSRSAGAVRIAGVHGTLAGPLSMDKLVLEQPNRQLTLEKIRIDWEPLALLNAQLHIASLEVGKLTLTGKMEQTPAPAQLPDSISLPLALRLDKVVIDAGEIAWGPLSIISLSEFAFKLDFDGRRYLLELQELGASTSAQADSVAATLSGEVTLATARPYALHGRLASGGTAVLQNRSIATNGQLAIDGSLAELAVDIDLAIKQARIQGHALLQPFSSQPLRNANIAANAIDLSAFRPDLPHTDIDARLSTASDGAGRFSMTNRNAGLVNEGKLPLTDMQIAFRQTDTALVFDRIATTLGADRQAAGAINGKGRYADGALTLGLMIEALDLRRLDRRMQTTHLAGKVDMRHAAGAQQLTVDLTEPVGKQNAALTARATLADNRLAIEAAELRLGNGRLNAVGRIDLSGAQSFSAEGRLSRFHLQDLGQFRQIPALDLTGKFSLQGARQPQFSADLAFNIDDSRFADLRVTGDGQVRLRADRILVPRLLLIAGDNRLNMQGELSSGDAQLSFMLAAPRLDQLGAGFGGALEAKGTARGSFAQPHVMADWSAARLRLPGQVQADNFQGKADLVIDRKQPWFLHAASVDASGSGLKDATRQLASLAAHLQFAPQANAPLAIDIRAAGLHSPQLQADKINATVQGTTAQHVLNATLIESANQNWTVAATGGLQQIESAPRWQGAINRFDAAGRFVAHLAAPAALTVAPARVQLDQFRLDASTATIIVEQFARDARGIATRGRVERLQLAKVLEFGKPQAALVTDLQLDGEWDVRLAESVQGSVSIRRRSGDVAMRGGTPVTLGLRKLEAVATAAAGRLNLRIDAEGQQLGTIDLNASTVSVPGAGPLGWSLAAPVSGSAKIDIPSLAWLGPLLSPSAVTGGRLQSDVVLGGTLAQPEFSGRIAGSALRVLVGDLGLDLQQGSLDSEFRGDTLYLKNFGFRNAGGSINASGAIGFADGKPDARIDLKAERFAVLNRSDRKLVLSGQSTVAWREGRASLSGAFDVDSGYFDIGREDMPQLSDDVVVVGRSKAGSGAMAATVDLRINIANVALKGRGLDGALAGQLRLTGAPGQTLRAQGSVQISQGTYSAYGRKLAIEQGALRFNGPLNNPALDIVAMRRGEEVEAGVAVRGTVLAPRVTLVSEPTVPDAEKLSWLVLGRALDTAGNADLGALQSAAGALLSQGAATGVQSQIATAFGLDDFRIANSQDTLQQRIVTLGKRLSSRLYVSYEQSLQTASSVVLLRYTLSPRLTLEVEAGTRSALSLLYNVAFD